MYHKGKLIISSIWSVWHLSGRDVNAMHAQEQHALTLIYKIEIDFLNHQINWICISTPFFLLVDKFFHSCEMCKLAGVSSLNSVFEQAMWTDESIPGPGHSVSTRMTHSVFSPTKSALVQHLPTILGLRFCQH